MPGFCSCHPTPQPRVKPGANLIEMAFAKIKTLIRKAAARTYDQLWQAVGNVCNIFKDEECYNFFKAAGYETDRTQHADAAGIY